MSKYYPYQNLSLDDLKGEKWDDIPGLDGYYQVSNFGRIKRLQRKVTYQNGTIVTLSERIKVLNVCKAPNEELGDFTFHLLLSVQVNNKTYRFSVRRLVYCRFVKEFALDDQSVLIVPKNGNGLDIRPENLKMIKAIQQRKLTYDNSRRTSSLKGRFGEEIKQASVEVCQKKISQYSKTGKRIRTYPSAREAERITGISHGSIGASARKLVIAAGGFYWRYGNAYRIDLKELLKTHRQGYKSRGMRVTQYDLFGNKIAEYPSILKAEQETGICYGSIRGVLLGSYKSAGNYYWRKDTGPDKIDLSKHKAGRQLRVKKVSQYTLEGEYLRSYDSIVEAAYAIQMSDTAISAACKGKNKTCKGFKWRFV